MAQRIKISLWESLKTWLGLYTPPRTLELSRFIQPNIPMLYSLGDIIDHVTTGCNNLSVGNQEHRITVPENERWILLGGSVDPDASAAVTVKLYNSLDQEVYGLGYEAAGTARMYYPELPAGTAVPSLDIPSRIMKEGDYVRIQFGASQSANCSVSLRYMVIPHLPNETPPLS